MSTDSRASEDLRQTAIRNDLTKTLSTPKLERTSSAHGVHRNRNIPMVPPAVMGRTGEWTSYTINQKPERASDLKEVMLRSKPTSTASISPLTEVRTADVAGEWEPQAYPAPSDNTFTRLQNIPSSKSSGGSGHLSSKLSRIYDKMGRFFPEKRLEHNSMFSLVPMSRSESELEPSEDEGDITEDRARRYLEDGIDIKGSEPGNETTVLDFMREVTGFRNTDLKNSSPASLFPVTRTHQKLLDMKDFFNGEETEAQNAFGNLFDYAVKIQNEQIVSQWNQIRLRFSKHSPGQKDAQGAGIIGSIQRIKFATIAKPASKTVRRELLDDYLTNLWQAETYLRDPGLVAEDTALEDNAYGKISAMAKSALLGRK